MTRDRDRKAWAGIGPAVDAHLHRWDQLHRVQEPAKLLSRSLTDKSIDKRALGRAVNVPILQSWVQFSMSYGIVTQNGVPMLMGAVHEGTTISGKETFEAEAVALPMAGNFAQREHSMLDRAVTHYISAEIVNEIDLAVQSTTCDPLFETDLFTPVGFAVLEEPFLVNDLDMDTGLPTDNIWLGIRAFGWQRIERIGHADDNQALPGIELFLYTTPEDYESIYIESLIDAGHEPPDHQNPVSNFLIIEVVPWRFGSQWDINDESPEYVAGFLPSPVAHQRKWFHTFMRFCWQEIIHHQRHAPERAERREWERLAKKKELLDYTTLRLRRYVDPEHVAYEGGGVPLTHRVKVRAHWTRQYYPTMGPARLPDGRMNPDSHRLIWIESYWKGPEDGPLGAMHAATSVVR